MGTGWISPFRIGVVVLLLVAAVVGWELTRGSTPSFRTASVGTGTVLATLDSVATITPVNQANLNFNVSGTVSTVDVSVGQAVTAGETLASLNLADLNANVITAQATLASATATLADAEASETASTSSTPASTSSPAQTSRPSSTSTPSSSPSTGTGQSAQDAQKIAGLQSTVVADQRQLDAASAQASASLRAASAACEHSGPPTSTQPAATDSGSSPAQPTTYPGGGGTGGGGGGGSLTCSQALSQASTAQTAVTAAIKKLNQDEAALNAALGGTSGSGGASSPGRNGGGSGSGGTGSGGTHSGGTGSPSASSAATTATTPSTTAAVTTADVTSTGTGNSGTGSSGSGTGSESKQATPQQLAVDQASIDTAQANLSDAQLAVGGANLTSTIAGTVASLSIAAGDSVTAGSTSTTAQIVVIGSGSAYDVSTDIPVTDIGEVAVGQQALVTPDSTNTELTGQVTAIGVLANSSSTTTTYPVTISLDSSDLGQVSGAEADVEIVVKKSVNVTTVPSSAVRTVGSVHLVTVVVNGTAKTTPVTLGTVGDILTQVTSGVTVGEKVSLADLAEPLPSTSTGTTGAGFGGGLGGAGLGGGAGFGAGGFGGGGRFGG